MVVNTLVVMEIAYLFNVRYLGGPSLTWQGVVGTRAVLLAVAGVTLAQLAVTFLPALQAVFDTRTLGLGDGLAIVAVGVVLFAVLEVEKWLLQRLGWAKGG
jgi:magnesium-transporting ATPase (P-type)